MNGNTVIYIDILFVINFIMDFIILWATSKFTGFATTFKRLLLASIFGASYSIIVYFPSIYSGFQSLLIKLLFSIFMIIIVFYPQTKKRFFQAVAYFYMIAFAAGGAMFAAVYLLDNQYTVFTEAFGDLFYIRSVSHSLLLVAIAASVIIGKYGTKYIKANFFKHMFQIPVIICLGENKVAIKTLVDTANELFDPISGKPVMIAELEVLKQLISKEQFDILQKYINGDINTLINCLADTPLATRIRVIPYTSIGKQKGMLLGIRPDEVIIVQNNKTIKIKDIIVGIYNDKLTLKGGYKGLLHPEVIKNGV